MTASVTHSAFRSLQDQTIRTCYTPPTAPLVTVYFCNRGDMCLTAVFRHDVCCAQEYPDVSKQPEWKGQPQPEAVDWKSTIDEALERGKDVPEVEWCLPGEDNALKVPLLAGQCRQHSLARR